LLSCAFYYLLEACSEPLLMVIPLSATIPPVAVINPSAVKVFVSTVVVSMLVASMLVIVAAVWWNTCVLCVGVSLYICIYMYKGANRV
jgi:hypothetical protein